MPLRLHTALHACARWVLGLWLCLALASAFAPLARASGWERLCSASGEAVWVPAPGGQDGAQAIGHGIDCPLCLPPLAPPAAQGRLLPEPTASDTRPAARPASCHLPALPALPQARAPPPVIS
ncbi:Uncharacterised protein [Delftia tsuruhatensis]|uniref:hypothetical protein n=1 Tax=Delftia tsuruhatensis TaxID=180282 RepID=UPI001E7D0C7E|nr:hypothetical protein [Delftia tsuruhatensis]CAB5697909.1 Uncharacterised protein [Delftia tsuruhatensis]CAC9676344.1 Uncharacterised protein [Delftia tsuruhatensis]